MKRTKQENISDNRIIGHIDLDCFYVQVERSINPTLKNKPVGVVQCEQSLLLIFSLKIFITMIKFI